MNESNPYATLSDEQLDDVHAACETFEQALRSEETIRIEDCIAAAPEEIRSPLFREILHSSYDDFMHRGIVGNDFEILPIEPRHTSLLTTLPLHPRDPFDRRLIVQATVEAIPIISGDVILDAYGVRRKW
jgi:hypothetical protein